MLSAFALAPQAITQLAKRQRRPRGDHLESRIFFASAHMSMKLIGSVTSPYVRKVRIVMAEKKLDYQFVTEDVWSAQTQIHV